MTAFSKRSSQVLCLLFFILQNEENSFFALMKRSNEYSRTFEGLWHPSRKQECFCIVHCYLNDFLSHANLPHARVTSARLLTGSIFLPNKYFMQCPDIFVGSFIESQQKGELQATQYNLPFTARNILYLLFLPLGSFS